MATKAREAPDTIWTAREAAEVSESYVDGLQGPIWTPMDHESCLGGPGDSRQPFGLLGRLQRPTRTAQEAAEEPFWTAWEDSPGGSEPIG